MQAPDGAGVVTARDPHCGGAGAHVWWVAGGTELPDPHTLWLAQADPGNALGDAPGVVHGPLDEVGSLWDDDVIHAVTNRCGGGHGRHA